MLIRKGLRNRIYPDQEQQERLGVQFGHTRFVYNHLLALRNQTYEETGKGLSYATTTGMLRILKQEPDYAWLKEADSQILQQSLQDLQRAFNNWFRMCKDGTCPSNQDKKPRKDGKPRGYPRFKSRHDVQSIRYPQRVKLEGKRIYLPKVGWVKVVVHGPLGGKLKNCTVSRGKSGKFYASLQCEVEMDDPHPRPGRIGIDVGLIDFLTTSEGDKVEAAKHLRRAMRRLQLRPRRLSRKQKGSKNRKKAQKRLAVDHERVADQRRDFHHQVRRALVDQYGTIAIENLNIKGLVRNSKVAKSISDAGWGQFIRFIRYKAEWSGGTILNVDRFFPSSKLCSACSAKQRTLQLSDRQWVCRSCGVLHDRDVNAAVNILKESTAGAAGSHALGDTIPVGGSAQEAHRL
jgi:putative transposase